MTAFTGSRAWGILGLLDGVELDRCLECDQLIRLESDTQGPFAARHVICLYRGTDFWDDLPW